MLTIVVPGVELFDENREIFVNLPEATLSLEHSLVSLSKWESIWEKPFLGPDTKTTEETLSYIECMCLAENTPSEVFQRLSDDNLEAVNKYIEAKMSATWFNEKPAPGPKKVITSELLYYWMVALTIPFECQYWHLNRLFALIKVANAENSPPKKMSAREVAEQNRALNEARRAKLNTTG